MTTKLFTAGFSLLASTGMIAEADNLLPTVSPVAPFGWMAMACTIALTIMVFMDKRKVAEASTAKAILDEKDKLIASRDATITYLETIGNKQKAEIDRLQEEIERYRTTNHAFRNDVNQKMLSLTEDNAAMKILLAEHNLLEHLDGKIASRS